ncbi:ankyrin repeat domain-containing protein [Terricaulis sp.]|uniref:ankyrin repeat domain-containing protein n=1 Tax=Terricaulis sp. TaxID=2768686 RepID=UPI0037845446
MTGTLVRALKANNLPRVKRAILDGEDVNEIGDGGWTPLFYAVTSARWEIVHLLLSNGANQKHRDAHGMTAQDYARLYGDADVSDLLSGTIPR